jgi:hypothetical protein
MPAADLDRVGERRADDVIFPAPARESILIVANRTIDSRLLLDAVRARAGLGRIIATLLVPLDNRERNDEVERRLTTTVDRMREADIEVWRALRRRADPFTAIREVYSPHLYGEIIISTLDERRSHWLRLDLPRRGPASDRCRRHPAVGVGHVPDLLLGRTG